jgi:predicted membrane-bound dolichyl-phosphate-mannose-protein mannosyltransferase
MRNETAKRLALLVCVALNAVFLVQGWAFIRANSQSHDEAVHLTAGYSYLATHDFRLNPEHPPLLKELAALPIYLVHHLPFHPAANLWGSSTVEAEKWTISRDFLYHSSVSQDELLTLGRLPGLLMGAAIVALVGWWAYRLWGPGAAVLGTALAAFEPNLVTNACLITTDVGSALFIFLTMYLFWEYGTTRSAIFLIGAGITTGLALASKLTGILLFGMGGLILVGHVVLPQSPLLPTVKGAISPPRSVRFKQAVLIAVVVTVLAALAILPPYFFQGWDKWLYGFGWQLSKGGHGHAAFFLGHYSDTGWYAYFPVAFLIKTPVASVALIAASLALFRFGTPLGLRDVLFLLVPVAIVLALMIPAKINIGVRYLMPIYPFLFVCAARLATLSFPRPWLAPVGLGVPVLLTALSTLRQAPHELPYFNEAIGGPDHGDRYLADTNIDWGQDLKGLREYMDREGLPMVYLSYFGTAPPEAYGIRYQEAPSFGAVDWPARTIDRLPRDSPRQVLAISVTNLQGAYLGEPGPYRPFYDRPPLAKIGYSIWIYDLTGDSAARRDLAAAYRFAADHERKVAARWRDAGNDKIAAQHEQVARQWDEVVFEE